MFGVCFIGEVDVMECSLGFGLDEIKWSDNTRLLSESEVQAVRKNGLGDCANVISNFVANAA